MFAIADVTYSGYWSEIFLKDTLFHAKHAVAEDAHSTFPGSTLIELVWGVQTQDPISSWEIPLS